ncbi:MAG: lipopolysaccharide kinase InaA family protein [Prevotella sp.]|jgi:serine/threonine protein kinase|nr:lipopolysaccharide kinase InaA family protein [Prevotella sp.]
MTVTVINPQYQQLEEFIKGLPLVFDESGDIIYSARNTVKAFGIEGYKINVKSFKKPFFINQIAYVTVRKSKARRSYENAVKLVEKGFATPDPVAYIEQKEFGLLTNSFYLSIDEEFAGMLRELRTGTVESHRELLRQFALYTADLHEKQVLHLDFSPGNILYKLNGRIYTFYLVDLNRMSFDKPIDIDTACAGFKRLWGSDDMIRFMIGVYAGARGFDEATCLEKAFKYRKEFWEAYKKRHPDAMALPYI